MEFGETPFFGDFDGELTSSWPSEARFADRSGLDRVHMLNESVNKRVPLLLIRVQCIFIGFALTPLRQLGPAIPGLEL